MLFILIISNFPVPTSRLPGLADHARAGLAVKSEKDGRSSREA
jgi:hypothetical protein